MKGKEKIIFLALIAFLLIAAWIAAYFEETVYYFPKMPKRAETATTDLSDKAVKPGDDWVNYGRGRTNYENKNMFVDDSFTSHLPLIIIDTGDEEPQKCAVWDEEKGYFVPTGEDPYIQGEISVINSSNGINSPTDDSETHSRCKVKLRGNSSISYDKKQYKIMLTDKDGKSENHNILNLGSDNEWILNVSFIDKSLLRNFLAYSAAGEIMPYTPDVQYCEVLWKCGDGYRYQGLYMMMESIKVGKNRVDLPQYSENSGIVPALLRRDRYNPNGIMLENYGTQNDLTYGYLDVEYPSRNVISEKGISAVTEQINRFEKALYSDTWEEFVRYRNYVDMESFIDYFIINEFFLNYDAGNNSTYMYMNYSGKITMGPVWDFDQAMDNSSSVAAELYTTAFHAAPWFDRMLQDPVFTAALIDRYAELRKSILSDEAIKAFVEKTTEYLGSAIDRDWARWGYFYIDGDYLQAPDPDGNDRNTHTHAEEVERMLDILSKHGAWLDENLDSLYQFKMLSLEDAQSLTAEKSPDYRSALAVIFVAAFFISVKLVLRYESMENS